ncbi:MAG TPA: glycosyltransferase, partial [Ilumatobacteraceae bacterium]|nr:glycosyltransferase [Ilumatobacteraceae bacterium]
EGPANARNVGLSRCTSPWVVFLDDDVVVSPTWAEDLDADLRNAGPRVAAIQGDVSVPLPTLRRPTDWERNVARLATAKWITADMALRRQVANAGGPFRTCFRRAYREDSDLALRLVDHGWNLEQGKRKCLHPVSRGDFWISVRKQRGNADDAFMRALHGRRFAERLGEGPSMMRTHWLTVASGAVAMTATKHCAVRKLATAVWVWCAATFAWRRIAPGPRSPGEVTRMIATSLVIPPAACFWSSVGAVQARRLVHGRRS